MKREKKEREAKVTFFEDGTGLIRNGTIVLHFNYTFTHDRHDDTALASLGFLSDNYLKQT
jgi:hypothetical protein